MTFSFNKNSTFARIKAGELSNIRTFQMPQGPDVNRADGEEIWVLDANTPGHGFSYVAGWQEPAEESVTQFSAACWYFAQELTDMAVKNNESVVPLGLIGTYWGGTMIEMWMKNDTVSECKNASGASAVYQRGDIHNGALYNGMLCPFLNMTVKGALWYQVEQSQSFF
jgi:hypothetical protein